MTTSPSSKTVEGKGNSMMRARCGGVLPAVNDAKISEPDHRVF
jgi:hypothetical protein